MKSTHLFACMLLGCTSTGREESPEAREPSGSTDARRTATPSEASEPAPNEPPGALLQRSPEQGGSITEIWLEARATAALSLDSQGGVLLWPALPPAQTDLDALAPIGVPIREPLWLSLARVDAQAFVIAAIDTAQSARVIAITIDDQGRARVRERFTIAPSDPLLELHVLEGGDRLLALGVDHRIRLYDGHGKLLAELAEYGLAPWQLRLAGPPEALQLAMVLAGPTRLQRFTITDDHITRVGEPRAFTLGRGPNRNDLTLLPSGRVAALLRRPNAETMQWSLELHDLDSGEVRVMWGEVASELRPRLHIVDDERALLEDGSPEGFWIDLKAGVVMPAPFVLPEALEQLPPESHVIAHRVSLPSSSQRGRRHASVVAGLRVIPMFGRELLLDPIDSDRHFRLGHHALGVTALALDGDGSQLAIASGDGRLVVESIADAKEHVVVGCSTKPTWDLQFTDRDHLLLVADESAQICAWQTGEVVSEVALSEHRRSFVRLAKPGSGALAIRLPNENVEAGPTRASLSTFTENHFGAFEPVAKQDLPSWPELLDDDSFLALDGEGRRYTAPKVDTRHFQITTPSGERRKLEVDDHELEFSQFEPSADGRHVAFVHEARYDEDGEYGHYYEYAARPSTMSVWSIADETPERLWSIPANGSMHLSWSADGSRMAFMQHAVRVVTPEGEIVFEQSQRDFHLDELPDAPPETP